MKYLLLLAVLLCGCNATAQEIVVVDTKTGIGYTQEELNRTTVLYYNDGRVEVLPALDRTEYDWVKFYEKEQAIIDKYIAANKDDADWVRQYEEWYGGER